MKKNNVSVDVVSFGCEEENREKLEAFHGAVNSGDTSHLVAVPAGTILSDMLFATPIFMEDGGEGAGAGAAAAAAAGRSLVVDGFDYGELGVDPTLDPELAMALRMSVEEERARVAREQQAAGAGEGAAMRTEGEGEVRTEGEGVGVGVGGEVRTEGEAGVENMEMDEDALLQQALALSMQGFDAAGGDGGDGNDGGEGGEGGEGGDQDEMMMMEGIDDPELQQALALSMQMAQGEENDKDDEKDDEKQEE